MLCWAHWEAGHLKPWKPNHPNVAVTSHGDGTSTALCSHFHPNWMQHQLQQHTVVHTLILPH